MVYINRIGIATGFCETPLREKHYAEMMRKEDLYDEP